MNITRDQARDFAEAHAEGLHEGIPREGCPECDGRDLKSYPVPCGDTNIGGDGIARSCDIARRSQGLARQDRASPEFQRRRSLLTRPPTGVTTARASMPPRAGATTTDGRGRRWMISSQSTGTSSSRMKCSIRK